MKKTAVIVFTSFLLLVMVMSSSCVSASLLTVKEDGNLEWKVLSSEDSTALGVPKRDSLTVKNTVIPGTTYGGSKIALAKFGDKFQLDVTAGGNTKNLDVTKLSGDLVEIEERPQLRSLVIGIEDGKFTITQSGELAVTDFPIAIDPASAGFTVETQTGSRLLAVLPMDVRDILVKSKTLSKINGAMSLTEGSKGELTYAVDGTKSVNLLNFYNLEVPVKSQVSATTGEILGVEAPKWLKVLEFLVG